MQKYFKHLERPVPGAGGTRIMGLVGFGESEPAESLVGMVGTPEVYEPPEHLTESLFLVPGSFDEEALRDCQRHRRP